MDHVLNLVQRQSSSAVISLLRKRAIAHQRKWLIPEPRMCIATIVRARLIEHLVETECSLQYGFDTNWSLRGRLARQYSSKRSIIRKPISEQPGTKIGITSSKKRLAPDFFRRLYRITWPVVLAYQNTIIENKSKNIWSNAVRLFAKCGN